MHSTIQVVKPGNLVRSSGVCDFYVSFIFVDWELHRNMLYGPVLDGNRRTLESF